MLHIQLMKHTTLSILRDPPPFLLAVIWFQLQFDIKISALFREATSSSECFNCKLTIRVKTLTDQDVFNAYKR